MNAYLSRTCFTISVGISLLTGCTQSDDVGGSSDDASIEESEDQVPGTEPAQPGEDGVRPDLREELDEQAPADDVEPDDAGGSL